jgi:Tol biopolymer transport system component
MVFGAEDGRREPFESDAWLAGGGIAWLPDGSGLVVSGNQTLMPFQVWLQPYPRGQARRVTNDWAVYVDVNVSGDGAIVASNRLSFVANLWTMDAAAGGQIRQLTFNSSYASTVFSFDTASDGSIVFSAVGDEHLHLWRIAEGGFEPRPITAGHGHEIVPRALAGGGIVSIQVGKDGTPHVFRVSDDGSGPKQLTAGSGEALVEVSPDGKVILFVRSEDPTTLWAVSATGGDPIRMVSPSRGWAKFSRDGSRIVYSDVVQEPGGTFRNTWRIIPAAGGAPTATLALPPQASDVDWAPDGGSLTFLDGSDSAANVFRRRLDSEKPERVTHFTEGQVTGHKWSSDGRRLLVKRHTGRADSLWTVAADGTDPVRLTDFRTGDIFDVRWKTDGRGIIFMYGNRSTDAVLIRNFR